jgi:hypothetical protein
MKVFLETGHEFPCGVSIRFAGGTMSFVGRKSFFRREGSLLPENGNPGSFLI